MKKKVIVYDFDKTLTINDTLFGFFRHCAKRDLTYYCKLPIYIITMVITKFGFLTNSKLKEIGVKLFLNGLSKESIENLSKSYKKKIHFNELYEKLFFDNNTNYFIISASFEDYLKPLFSGDIRVVGSKLKYVKMQVNGLEFNCYKESKKEILNSLGVEKIDLFYTDSYSDFALANISQKIIIIDKSRQVECNSIEEFKRYFRK